MLGRHSPLILLISFFSCVLHANGPFGEPLISGRVNADPINEASGLAVSRKHDKVLWTHNDSGDDALFYAIHENGRLLGTFTLKDAIAFDYEGMSLGPGPEAGLDYLYIGDIGNNDAHRGKPRIHITLYRLPEPRVDARALGPVRGQLESDALVMRYPDGAHDAEVLMVDPRNGDIYILTKRDPKSRIYRAPKPAAGDQEIMLEYLGEMAMTQTTGGDIAPDGSAVLVKGYGKVWYFPRSAGASIGDALRNPKPVVVETYKVEPQGEAIAFAADGRGFFTLSEARKAESVPLYFYPLAPDK